MRIFVLRTDKPESEIGLYDDHQQRDFETWLAHRNLAETIHLKIKAMLDKHDITIQNVEGIVVYRGPGSFTGLRIGISLANALASSGEAPIVGESGVAWIDTGIKRLLDGKNDQQVSPEYGSSPHITQPRK